MKKVYSSYSMRNIHNINIVIFVLYFFDIYICLSSEINDVDDKHPSFSSMLHVFYLIVTLISKYHQNDPHILIHNLHLVILIALLIITHRILYTYFLEILVHTILISNR